MQGVREGRWAPVAKSGKGATPSYLNHSGVVAHFHAHAPEVLEGILPHPGRQAGRAKRCLRRAPGVRMQA